MNSTLRFIPPPLHLRPPRPVSAEAVPEAGERAFVTFDRIVEAVE